MPSDKPPEPDESLLSGAGRYFRSVVEASNDCVRVLSPAGAIEYMNPRGQALFEIADFERNRGKSWPSQWPLETRGEVERALQEALAGRTTTFRAFCPTARGAPRWWDTTVSPILDASGEVTRILATSRDVSSERQAEAQRRLLVNELNHRVKNTLATVQSIAAQSLRNAGVDRAVRDALEGRLMAVAATHNVLTDEHWEAVGLREIVRGAVSPYCPRSEQLSVNGDDLRVAPRSAVTLALALHELAINAVKYGALSDGGRVAVTCTVDRTADHLGLSWLESGGPAVSVPTRRGFGSRILEQALPTELQGTVALDYRPAGLSYVVEGVLSAVEA
jgi:PAS domain S-box-containing protein